MPPLRWLLFSCLLGCGNSSFFPPPSDHESAAPIPAPFAPSDAFRSRLYPENWQPGFTVEGRFLHDFSYAGYHRGEKELPRVQGPSVSVLAFGADPLGQTDSTPAFQAAIDALSNGGLVLVPEGRYVFDGQLKVRRSNTVLRGEKGKTFLHFRRTENMVDEAQLEFLGTPIRGPPLALVEDAHTGDTRVKIAGAESLQVGDEVELGWNISDDFVAEHGMTGTWKAFNGTWQVFFWRTITRVNHAVTPPEVEFDIPLRYRVRVRDGAAVRKREGDIAECGLEELQVSTATTKAQAWRMRLSHAVRFQNARDSWLRNVNSFAPAGHSTHLASGGIKVLSSRRLTLENTRMAYPENRGEGGNGYLFEISMSGEILVKDAEGIGGRHNFIQNWGFGTSGCVFLRCQSREGRALFADWDPVGQVGHSEFHHSLAMANLIDGGLFDDGFEAKNRGRYSSGAGHTSTENVFWNVGGKGVVRSRQYGHGYVVGPSPTLSIDVGAAPADGSAPEDFLEEVPPGKQLTPTSLYESQLARRRTTF